MNEENINSLMNTRGKKLLNNFKIEKAQINKPKLKVIDIWKIVMPMRLNKTIKINQRNFNNIYKYIKDNIRADYLSGTKVVKFMT